MKLTKTLATLFLAGVTVLASFAHAATDPKISVQLWSVKEDLSKDFEGTLKKLADMGFQGVEFAGNYGPYAEDPKGLKKFLKKHGLRASGAHVGFDKFNDENFDKTVKFFKALDAKYLVVPMDQRAFSPDGVEQVVAELTANAKKLKAHGLQTGYHNHAQEFADYQGTTYWDYIAANTPKDVILQLDVGWTTVAGKDPVQYVRKYPGRTLTTHYKAGLPQGTEGKLPIIGQDVIDWKAVITANREVGGTKWLVVEQEEYPNGMTPLEAVEASMKGLQQVLADMSKKN